MSKKLLFSLIILTCLISTSFADTLHIKKLGISFEGKHIKDDLNSVYFGINIFKKSGKTFDRYQLVFPKDQVSYEIVTVNEEKDPDESTIEKLLTQADQWIYTKDPENAYHRYLRARNLMLEKEKDNETIDDEIKKHIYSGILRFKLDDYFKRMKQTEQLKEFSRCIDIFDEFSQFLYLKTLQCLKTYEIELQITMRALLHQKRSDFFTLIDKKLQKSKAAQNKFFDKLEKLFTDIKTLYNSPNNVDGISLLSNMMNLSYDEFNQIHKRANIDEKSLKIFDEKKVNKIKFGLGDSDLLSKLHKLSSWVFADKPKRIKEMDEKIKTYEDEFKKYINFELVGKVNNKDVFEFKTANQDVFEEGTASLDKNEKELYDKINGIREILGLNPLIIKAKTLQDAAESYLRKLIKQKTISHEGTDGSTPRSRAKKAGWKGSNVGENLYRGTKDANTPQDVLTAWFKSLEHLKNLISKDYDSCGLAQASYNWCMMFGGP